MSKFDFTQYNSFNLSHDKKLTCEMGKLVPVMCKEVMPGDVFRCNANLFMRLIPQLAPFMHQVDCFLHFFFVPSRLLQKNFETFITKGFSGNENIPWAYIQAPAGGFGKYTLMDYFGLPIDKPNIKVSALPVRGYNLIYNEWYVNENLQDYLPINLGDGLDTSTSYAVQNRNWNADYFTSALPFAQRGDPVYLPLATTAPVYGDGSPIKVTSGNATRVLGVGQDVDGNLNQFVRVGQANPSTHPLPTDLSVAPLGSNNAIGLARKADLAGSYAGATTGMYTDLSAASGVTVNAARVAFQVQRWMEKNARGGVRYIEFLLNHFKVKSSDARLQRPEYLGGGRSTLFTSEVLQTSATDSTSPQGNMSGHTMTGQSSIRFTRQFEEFGYVYCIMSVLPKTQYQQGIERMWTRETPLDYPFPVFSHLGAQEVKNKEIYAQGTEDDEKVFGFQDRYQELRTAVSTVSGDFRDTLDYWTMTRKFDSLPQLNGDFVSAKDVTKRIFTVTNAQPCLVDIGFNLHALRKLPKHGTPGLIDHG